MYHIREITKRFVPGEGSNIFFREDAKPTHVGPFGDNTDMALTFWLGRQKIEADIQWHADAALRAAAEEQRAADRLTILCAMAFYVLGVLATIAVINNL